MTPVVGVNVVNFVEATAAEFDQKDANLSTLNHHKCNFIEGVHFGVKKSIFFQWNEPVEPLSFLAAIFASNAEIFQPQSAQVRWLMAKMHGNAEQLHTVSFVTYARVLSDQRYSTLQKAIFVNNKL